MFLKILKCLLTSSFAHSIHLHFRPQYGFLTNPTKFQSISSNRNHMYEISRPPLFDFPPELNPRYHRSWRWRTQKTCLTNFNKVITGICNVFFTSCFRQEDNTTQFVRNFRHCGWKLLTFLATVYAARKALEPTKRI